MRLMVDDERAPPSGKWEIARSYAAAVWYFENVGCPAYLSLDHDLGTGPTGHDLCKWLVEASITNQLNLSNLSTVHIHSANPIGAMNMRSLLQDLFRHLYDEGKLLNIPIVTTSYNS